MTTELPCPFCDVSPTKSLGDCGAPYPGYYFTIECLNEECPAEVNVCEKRRTDIKGLTLEEAIEKVWPEIIAMWNTRSGVEA